METRSSSRLWAILVATLVVASAGEPARAEDALCYRASARRADRVAIDVPVAVQDRFGVRSVLPGRPTGLCRPVGDDDAASFQVVRRASVDGGRRARRIGETVERATRFGVERVKVKSVRQVVVAGASGAAVPPTTADRATCYRTKGSRRARGVVVVSDARGEHVLHVGSPRRLCVFASGAEQLCHAAKPVRGSAVDGGGETVVTTSFGSERLDVARVVEICVEAGDVEPPPPPDPDFFLRITPSALSVTAGEQARLEARAFFDAGGSEDWSDRLTWTSSDETVAVVRGSVGGALVDAVGRGTATISAVDPATGASTSDAHGDAEVTVIWTLEKLTMQPAAVRKPVGGVEDYTVTGHFAGGVAMNLTQRVVYASSNPSVVTTPNMPGRRSRVHAVGPGLARISARDPISGIRTTDAGNDATIRVAGGMPYVVVDPARGTRLVLDVGTVHQFTAVAVFPDGIEKNVTQECVWSSSDDAVMAYTPQVGQASRFTAVGTGTAIVQCREPASGAVGSSGGDVVTGEIVGIVLRGADHPPIFEGRPRRLTAIGTFAPFVPDPYPFMGARNVTQDVVYVSRDPDVVAAPNEPGDRSRLEGVQPGVGRVYAFDPVTGVESPDHTVVNFGALVGVRLVRPPYRNTLVKGASYRFRLSAVFEGGRLDPDRFVPDAVVVLESDDESIVAIDDDVPATVVAVGAGTTTVRARLVALDVASNEVAITVKGDVERLAMTPTAVRRAIDEVQRFTVRAFSPPDFDDLYTQRVEYRSSDPSVAVALNTPFDRSAVRMVGAGTAVISARDPVTGVSSDDTGDSATIEVLPGAIERVTIAPTVRTIARGDSTAFTATGHYADGRTINVTPTVRWVSSDPTVATTGGNPRISGIGAGSARIVAVHPSGVGSSDSDDDATLLVEELAEIVLTPATRIAAVGTSVRYTVVGRFADGGEINLTQKAYYSVSASELVVAANDDDDRSRLDLVGTGTVTVYAWVLGRQASATLTIID